MMNRDTLVSLRDTMLETGHSIPSYFRRVAYRSQLAPVDQRDHAILNGLKTEGAYSTNIETVGVPGSAEMIAAADRLFDEMSCLPRRKDNKDYMIGASADLITNYPDIIKWGLNERFLAIAENYIGLPVNYRGVLARLDMPDGSVRETRLWHLDQEDTRILKIVVYASDVNDDAGPFEYVRASCRQPLQLARGSKKRVGDEQAFDRAVPSHARGAVVGPRGTVGFVDTCRVLHRGRLPVTGTRRSLFFAYNSRWPTRPSHCTPMFVVDRFKANAGALTTRQAQAIDFGY